MQCHRRTARTESQGAFKHGGRCGEGNDLDGSHHRSGGDRRQIVDRRECQAFVDPVDSIDDIAIDAKQAGPGGVEIDPAGKGCPRLDIRRDEPFRQPVRRIILMRIIVIEAGGGDGRQPGPAQESDILAAQASSLGEAATIRLQAVRQNGPSRIIERNPPEAHPFPVRHSASDPSFLTACRTNADSRDA